MKRTSKTRLELATMLLMFAVLLAGGYGCAPKAPKEASPKERKATRPSGESGMLKVSDGRVDDLGHVEDYQRSIEMSLNEYKRIGKYLFKAPYLRFTTDEDLGKAQNALENAASIIESARLAGYTNEMLSAYQMQILAEKKRIADRIADHPFTKNERVAFLSTLEADMIDIPYAEWAISKHEIIIPKTMLEFIDANAKSEGLLGQEEDYFLLLLNQSPELLASGLAYSFSNQMEVPSAIVPQCTPWVNKEEIDAKEEMGKKYHIYGFRLARPRSLSKDEIETIAKTTKGLVDGIAADMVEIPDKDYAICKYEVTQALWEIVMRENPSKEKDGRHPIENVSFVDCELFVKRLNLFEKINARLEKRAARNYRIPTVDEWEYACRARCGGHYCKLADGTDIDEDTLHDVAWYRSNATHPVGEKKPNAFGLYDMLGNVWEWTSTIGCYEYSNEDFKCALRTKKKDYRVICGGGYSTLFTVENIDMWHLGQALSAGNHYSMWYCDASEDVGFRLAADKKAPNAD